MVKLLTLFITFSLLTLPVFSSSYQLIFTSKINNGAFYSQINPFVDTIKELTGFICSDTSSNNLTIINLDGSIIDKVQLDGKPLKSIYQYSTDKDSLIVYTITDRGINKPVLYRLSFNKHNYHIDSIIVDYPVVWGTFEKVNNFELKYHYDRENKISGVILSMVVRFKDLVIDMGVVLEDVSVSYIYNPELKDILFTANVSKIITGYVSRSEKYDIAMFENYYYFWDFQEYFNSPDTGEYRYTSLSLTNYNNYSFKEEIIESGITYDIFIDDFIPEDSSDKIIINGCGQDLLGNHFNGTNYLACYSIIDENVIENWYAEFNEFKPLYYFKPNHLLIGQSSYIDKLIILDTRTGEWKESIYFDHNSNNLVFFETGKVQPLLNMLRTSGDSVFVYDFKITTNSYQPVTNYNIPTDFTLFQNQPNPFNGETKIKFNTDIDQFLSLKVFNILGQEVITLSEGIFSEGTYFASWDGFDLNGIAQSSGIYFVKLNSANNSQIIKLIYLK